MLMYEPAKRAYSCTTMRALKNCFPPHFILFLFSREEETVLPNRENGRALTLDVDGEGRAEYLLVSERVLEHAAEGVEGVAEVDAEDHQVPRLGQHQVARVA